jgi:hypothetical protein
VVPAKGVPFFVVRNINSLGQSQKRELPLKSVKSLKEMSEFAVREFHEASTLTERSRITHGPFSKNLDILAFF